MDFIIGIGITAAISVFAYFWIVKPIIINPFMQGLKGPERPGIVSTSPSTSKIFSTNEPDPLKEKGDAFEIFVAQKFDKKYFKFQEWRSDKYSNGIYPEANRNPDFEIEFILNDIKTRFAVECKFKSKINYESIIITDPHKIDHYRKYSSEKNIPVFIALGLGGQANRPHECYIIPLNQLKSETILYSKLQRFRRYKVDSNFFFDYQTYQLK